MRRWQDIKLEDQLRDEVECPQCKVDVHTFFGDSLPTVRYNCLHDANKYEPCKCKGDINSCKLLNGLNIANKQCAVSNKYINMLNMLEDRIRLEEKKYPLTDREQMFADAIKDILTELGYTKLY